MALRRKCHEKYSSRAFWRLGAGPAVLGCKVASQVLPKQPNAPPSGASHSVKICFRYCRGHGFNRLVACMMGMATDEKSAPKHGAKHIKNHSNYKVGALLE